MASIFRALSRAARRLDRWAHERNAPRLETDDRGFTILRRWRKPVTVRWDEIAGLVAWKRDELTTDLLCISVDCPGRDVQYVVHEEMVGFERWQDTMERVLSVDPAWYRNVVFPAFAANVTRIYRRARADVVRPA